MNEAKKSSGSANRGFFVRDCTGNNGMIQKAISSAFFMASQVL
jgi:hypothetical protein